MTGDTSSLEMVTPDDSCRSPLSLLLDVLSSACVHGFCKNYTQKVAHFQIDRLTKKNFFGSVFTFPFPSSGYSVSSR